MNVDAALLLKLGSQRLFAFGLGNHALALVEYRQARVQQEVFGIVLYRLLGTGQCRVQIASFS